MMAIKKPKSKKLSSQKQAVGKEKQTRIEILRTIAERADLSKTQVESVFSTLTELIVSHMKKRGSGEFTIPMTGIKVRRVKKKATKARTMVSPLTGQEVVIAGKPARHAVKISALKVLKEAVVE
jgi:nucleoid DNA-binding protein